MKLYSHNNQYPKPLPDRIFLSNGLTRTDKTTFTDEELLDAGYILAPLKPVASAPDKFIDWDGSNWYERDFNNHEIEVQWRVIQERVDYLVSEADELIAQNSTAELITYRENLLAVTANNTNPFIVNWPVYAPDGDPVE